MAASLLSRVVRLCSGRNVVCVWPSLPTPSTSIVESLAFMLARNWPCVPTR